MHNHFSLSCYHSHPLIHLTNQFATAYLYILKQVLNDRLYQRLLRNTFSTHIIIINDLFDDKCIKWQKGVDQNVLITALYLERSIHMPLHRTHLPYSLHP